jgi:CheY-like chemotaxis protein
MDSLSCPTALVVDDYALVAIDIERNLRALGFANISTCTSVAEAMRTLQLDKPDFVTVDITLRDGEATPLVEYLRNLGIPFIFVTVYPPDRRAGGDAPWVVKPFEDAELREAVRVAMAGAQASA